MENVSLQIDRVGKLSSADKELLFSYMKRLEVKKSTRLIEAKRVERYVYWIEKGIARAFYQGLDQETTIWLGEEGDMMLSYLSFFKQMPGYESIEMMEDSVVYRLLASDLQNLFDQNLNLVNWGKKLVELELLKTEQRLMDLQFKSAKQRYEDLLQSKPSILQRIPLKYVASYLGITQVSLSRIRAKKA